MVSFAQLGILEVNGKLLSLMMAQWSNDETKVIGHGFESSLPSKSLEYWAQTIECNQIFDGRPETLEK